MGRSTTEARADADHDRLRSLSSQNFFLLHLSLLREYLDLEFSSISEELEFEYDLERIIDDFILLSVFVGNDFLPHLPNLHIGEGAMEEIWGIYKRVLPRTGEQGLAETLLLAGLALRAFFHADGYINDTGTIDTGRLQLVLNELASVELEIFEKEYADLNWYKGKQQKEIAAMEAARSRGQLGESASGGCVSCPTCALTREPCPVMTKKQKTMFAKIRAFSKAVSAQPSPGHKLEFVNDLPARDRRFLQELADALYLEVSWDEVDGYGQSLAVLRPAALDPTRTKNGNADKGSDEASATDDDEDSGSEATTDESSESEHEARAAVDRVLDKYQKAKIVDDTVEDFEESYEQKLQNKHDDWKADYYKNKLEFKNQEEDVKKLAFRYIEGLQWVMNYYYKGVASWGWFYDYHYAPRISGEHRAPLGGRHP